MLHHVSVGVRDVTRAATFYDPVLKALGYSRVMEFLPHAIAYGESEDRPEFWIQIPHDQQMATQGNGTHVGFVATSKEAVEAFHAAALAAGGSNDGEPGPRPDYGPEYYGAFIYDLDGNKIEATLHLLVADAAADAAQLAARQERRAAKKAKRKKRKQARKNKKQGGKKAKKGKRARAK
ncbi:MAG: VOC family protein [Rhizomicrobium sp.]|jgi:catechol 2,3-dioxygenase-like lactoylglutathione lyase family enzyme